MSNAKMYVGNLPFSVDSNGLKEIFSPFGTVVSANVIVDRDSDDLKSKGYGFVEMGSAKEAEKAIMSTNGKDHLGRELKVNEAEDRASRNRF